MKRPGSTTTIGALVKELAAAAEVRRSLARCGAAATAHANRSLARSQGVVSTDDVMLALRELERAATPVVRLAAGGKVLVTGAS